MVRILQALTVLALISSGVVFLLCAGQWLQGASESEEIEQNLGPSVLEKFRRAGGGEKSGQETHSALVRQAETFALYLNPPQPPQHRQQDVVVFSFNSGSGSQAISPRRTIGSNRPSWR